MLEIFFDKPKLGAIIRLMFKKDEKEKIWSKQSEIKNQ